MTLQPSLPVLLNRKDGDFEPQKATGSCNRVPIRKDPKALGLTMLLTAGYLLMLLQSRTPVLRYSPRRDNNAGFSRSIFSRDILPIVQEYRTLPCGSSRGRASTWRGSHSILRSRLLRGSPDCHRPFLPEASSCRIAHIFQKQAALMQWH